MLRLALPLHQRLSHLPRAFHLQTWRRSTGATAVTSGVGVGVGSAKVGARLGGEGAGVDEGADAPEPRRNDAGSSALRFEGIDELLASLKALRGDPLEADGGNIVVYRGNPKARVMIIG